MVSIDGGIHDPTPGIVSRLGLLVLNISDVSKRDSEFEASVWMT